MKALIFDCDGVLVDTERDGHRIAFNRAFFHFGLNIEWSVDLYGELLKISGGKERMRYFFQENGWPENATDHDPYVKDLHKVKTDLFMQIIESGELPLRSGIARLIDEAIEAGLKLAICSTSNERSVNLIAQKMLGRARYERFDHILAGDVVSRKKPDPEIYNLAKERLGLRGEECLVVEDSRNGLLAVKGAGLRCLVTTSAYTAKEDFSEADLVVEELGDPPERTLSLSEIKEKIFGRYKA